jgi:hypothetical protein
MNHNLDDCSKLRLTEPVEILAAVNILRSHGFEQDDLLSEITRWFYVDLDTYNEVIRTQH